MNFVIRGVQCVINQTGQAAGHMTTITAMKPVHKPLWEKVARVTRRYVDLQQQPDGSLWWMESDDQTNWYRCEEVTP